MIKINSLELENVKRIKAVSIAPTADGLTIIGGRNGQGKTSVLDAIAWALGGEKFRPTDPQNTECFAPPHLKVTLSNGLVVERKGKNSALTVTDPAGQRAGQRLLDEFISAFALDLPKFLEASNRDKAEILLKIIGIGPKLTELDLDEQRTYQQRLEVGRIADRKAKHAKDMPTYSNVPADLISASDLIAQQQNILRKNAENQQKRLAVNQLENRAADLDAKKSALKKQLAEISSELTRTLGDLEIARASAAFLHDESTAELEENIRHVDELNAKVRANMERAKAEMDAEEYAAQYTEYSGRLDQIRDERKALLDHADLPLPELTVQSGELVYKGHKWDCMSSAEQLRVGTAIVRKLNPDCGFVLLDKLEQMDMDTLFDFAAWLESEGLQAIATRVSTGDECSVIIEDGYAVRSDPPEKSPESTTKTWQKGVF